MVTPQTTTDPMDPEALLRQRVRSRLVGVPPAVPDPVWGPPAGSPPPPVAAPAPPVAAAPVMQKVSAAPLTQPTAPLPGTSTTNDRDPRDPPVSPTPQPPDPPGTTPPVPPAPPPPNGTVQEFLKEWMATHPASGGIGPLVDALKGAGYTNVSRYMYGDVPSNNELLLDGQRYKVLSNENGANPQWYTAGQNDGGGAGPAPGGQTDFQAALRAILMQRLTAAGQPIDPNDPQITGPMNAAQLEADRATQQERTALAERMYAQGDTSGTMDRSIQQSAERNAVGLGTLRATIVGKLFDAKRQELSDLLQMALAANDAQAARDIQAAYIALQKAEFEYNANNKAGNP